MTDRPEHASSSKVQQAAEPIILASLAAQENLEVLEPRSIQLQSGARIEVDGCTPDRSTVVEVYARQGRLKGAQFKKVAQDILKLALLRQEEQWASTRAIICFASAEARASVTGWLQQAATAFNVELLAIEALPQDLRAEILLAQQRQIMVNAGDVADDVPVDSTPLE